MQGSTLRGVLESETPSCLPGLQGFAGWQSGGLLESGGKKSSINQSMQLVESMEKIVFPMRFTDKLNSVSHFCLQFEWTTRSAIFGVSCSKFVRRKPFFVIPGQLGSQSPIISR